MVSVEISYYPLADDFNAPIREFLNKLSNDKLIIESGKMSTIIIGEYSDVMDTLSSSMGNLMDKYPSVFNIKISNSCIV